MNERTVAQPERAVVPPLISVSGAILQRKCACGQHTIAGAECEECRRKSVEASFVAAQSLQRHSAGAEPVAVPPIAHEVLRSPGQPLDPAPRVFFKPRFGGDFWGVRGQSPLPKKIPTEPTVNQVGDEYEQEADRKADDVMRVPDSRLAGRFGQDFSRVRVHADARAVESARKVNSLAYTNSPSLRPRTRRSQEPVDLLPVQCSIQ